MKLEQEIIASIYAKDKLDNRALKYSTDALEYLRTYEESCVSQIDSLIEEASSQGSLDIDKELVFRQYLITLRKFYKFVLKKDLLEEDFILRLSLVQPKTLTKLQVNNYLNIYLEILRSIILPNIKEHSIFYNIALNILLIRNHLKVLDGRTDTEVGKRLTMQSEPLKLVRSIIFELQSLIYSTEDIMDKGEFKQLTQICYLVLHLFDLNYKYFDESHQNTSNSVTFNHLNYAFNHIVLPKLRYLQCQNIIEDHKLTKVAELCKVNGRNMKKALRKQIPGLCLEDAIPILQTLPVDMKEQNFIDAFVGIHMLNRFSLEQKQEIWNSLKTKILSKSGCAVIVDDFNPHFDETLRSEEKLHLLWQSYGQEILKLIHNNELELAKYEMQKLLLNFYGSNENKYSLKHCINDLNKAGFKNLEVHFIKNEAEVDNDFFVELKSLISTIDQDSILSPNYNFDDLLAKLNSITETIQAKDSEDKNLWAKTDISSCEDIPSMVCRGGVYAIFTKP